MTKLQMLANMESLLKELAIAHNVTTDKPNWAADVTKEIITDFELNSTQKLMLLYMEFGGKLEYHQRELCDSLGLAMKTVRLNLRSLYELDIVTPGTKSYTWVTNG